MKNEKALAGILAVAVVLTIVGGVQYTSKPDTYGLDSSVSQTVMYNIKNPFQPERGFSIFVPQNSTILEKIII